MNLGKIIGGAIAGAIKGAVGAVTGGSDDNGKAGGGANPLANFAQTLLDAIIPGASEVPSSVANQLVTNRAASDATQ